MPLPCTIEMATNQIAEDDMQRDANAARAKIPLLDELRAIARKAPDPQRPIGEQIALNDAARFTQITQQMQQMQLSSLIESAHVRDASVVQQMFMVARKSYSNPSYKPGKADVPATALVTMRAALPQDKDWAPPTDAGCTIDAALARDEGASINRVVALAPTLQRDLPIMQRLRERYGIASGATIDASKLDPEDARTVETIQVELQPLARERLLANDIQHIRDWWAAAGIVYSSRKEDFATYASADHIGDTLDAKMAALSPEQRGLIGIWKVVDERVPSAALREMNRTAKQIQALQGAR